MHNLTESSLLLQIPFVLIATIVFFISVEAFGYLFLRTFRSLWNRKTRQQVPEFLDTGIVLHTFIGGLIYCLFMFIIGLCNILTPGVVIAITLATPVLSLATGRYRNLALLRGYITKYRLAIVGVMGYLLITVPLWFRPVINFDGTWYHLMIPKLFLQHHNIDSLGVLISYSVQPSMPYYWNLWPLSLPIQTSVAGIIVNAIVAGFAALAIFYASHVAIQTWKLSKYYYVLLPIILGSTYEILRMLGTGGSDLIGMSYGLVACLYCFRLLRQKTVSWPSFVIGVLLIVGLATIKIFFSLFAALLLLYFAACSLPKLPKTTSVFRQLLKITAALAIIFALTYLPWLIRAYIETGYPLFPAGAPGFNEGVYRAEGGGDFYNHWSSYVFTRLYDQFVPIMTFIYTPLFLIGTLSIFHKDIRSQGANLWLVANLGFWVTYFGSIVLQWRYYLPAAAIVVVLGIVCLIRLSHTFDVFGRTLILGAVLILTPVSIFRAVYSIPDSTGFPSIMGDIYLSNFNGTNNFVGSKISPKSYDYMQSSQPSDLKSDEKIYIGNSVTQKNIPIFGFQKMAYIDNPIIEPHVNAELFKGVSTDKDFVNALRKADVRYILTRDSLRDVCRAAGVRKGQVCSDKQFTKVLYDSKWEVTWYKIRD